MVCLITAILIEFFFMDIFSAHVSVQSLEYFTLISTFILLTDIYLSFLKSADKKEFLKKNALKILILLPWGTFFRALSFLGLERAVAEMPFFAEFFAAGKLGAGAGKATMIAEKSKCLTKL